MKKNKAHLMFLLLLLIVLVTNAKKTTEAPTVTASPIPTNIMCRDTPQCLSVSNGDFCQPSLICIDGYCNIIPDTPCLSQTQSCDEVTRQCIAKACTVAEDCDDGVFCNGRERCINQTCQPSRPKSRCTPELCNETTRTCAETRRLAHWRNVNENDDYRVTNTTPVTATPAVIGPAETRLAYGYGVAAISMVIFFTLVFLMIALVSRNYTPIPTEGSSWLY